MSKTDSSLGISMASAGIAALVCDSILYPLDTVKTRLQSKDNFWKIGGFHGLYKGFVPAMMGTVPSACLFFAVYDTVKHFLNKHTSEKHHTTVHVTAAAAGELVCNLVKVPTEIFKQRQQANRIGGNLLAQCKEMYCTEGFKGFYIGYGSTLVREIPFSAVQFAVWEYFKEKLYHFKQKELTALDGAICGGLSGMLAGAVTTPIDVAKTRIMLGEEAIIKLPFAKQVQLPNMLYTIYIKEGAFGLFSGLYPRVVLITLGGVAFFGSYEFSRHVLDHFWK